MLIKILKLFCMLNLHWWDMFNCVCRSENGQLMSDIAAIPSKEKIKELIYYSRCKSCNKIRIDAHYKWNPGTERFGDNLAHGNNNGLLEIVVRKYLKNNNHDDDDA